MYYGWLLPGSDNNDTIEWLPSKKQQEGANQCLHKIFPVCDATRAKTDKGKPQQLCLSVAFTKLGKFGLHSNMLPNLADIIKLFKATIKMKISLLMYMHFL